MPVTVTPTEAGTMPLAAEFVKTIADGLETLAQAAIRPSKHNTVLRGGRVEPRKVPVRTPRKTRTEVRSVSRNARDKAPRHHNPR